MDTTVVVGTDVANFWLYDPTLLAHRTKDPWSWCWDFYGDPWVPEYCDGRLISCLGLTSDGTYRIRCTTTPMSRAEARRFGGGMEPGRQLRIASGTLYVDGGYVIPCADHGTPSNEEYLNYLERQCFVSLSLEPGLYSVYIHHVLRLEPLEGEEAAEVEVEDELPDIVITFRLVS